MNRLLSFTPEPFETASELENVFQAYGATRGGFDQESELEYSGARGRSSYLPGTSAVSKRENAPASETEGETVGFVRPRRRTPSRQASPYATAPSALPPFDSKAFRQKIVRLAGQELARWGSGKIKETNPAMRRVLQDYWRTGTGRIYGEDQLGDPAFQKDHPWSAAFISWIMKTAGAGNAFKYSSSHATYTRSAKDNRLASNNNPFKAYRIGELAPQAGDLICKSRSGSAANYENIRPGMKTHCDIVTEVRPGKLVTVGGNVSNSVGQTSVRTDASGRIAEPNYFAVIRFDSQQPSIPVVPSPAPVQPMPTAHWRERIQGAPFLATRSGGAGRSTPSPAAKQTEEEFEAELVYEMPLPQALVDKKAKGPGIYTLFKNNRPYPYYVGEALNMQKRLHQHKWCLKTLADVNSEDYRVKLTPIKKKTDKTELKKDLKAAEQIEINKWGRRWGPKRVPGGKLTNWQELEEELFGSAWQ